MLGWAENPEDRAAGSSQSPSQTNRQSQEGSGPGGRAWWAQELRESQVGRSKCPSTRPGSRALETTVTRLVTEEATGTVF